MSANEDTKWFRDFVERSRWRFAKTYVESYPHEYTVQRWTDPAEFESEVPIVGLPTVLPTR